MRATPITSPLGASPAMIASAVRGVTRSTACAIARRSVTGFSPTSTMRAWPLSSKCVSCAGCSVTRTRPSRRGVGPLSGGDQVTHGVEVTGAQKVDRIRIAVDDRFEELLAVLVGRERGLGPASRVVEHDRQLGVLLAEQLADLPLH